MVSRKDANKTRQKRHKRVRGKLSGTAECPRLNVYRSLSNIYVQLIDDVRGVTLAQASTVEKDFAAYGGNVEAAKAVGKAIAERAKAIGIEKCVFDRGGYVYHGRVAAVADSARDGGLKF
ncbi:MAG: 50S ribosomal protein L18 [Clostridiales bacterium]|nr:50S ribosomal protein L18 [Clostridiales bacterium]